MNLQAIAASAIALVLTAGPTSVVTDPNALPGERRFSWTSVSALRTEVGCDARRHTPGGAVLAFCASGAVHVSAQGKRVFRCERLNGVVWDADVWDISDSGYAVGHCHRHFTRWAPDGSSITLQETVPPWSEQFMKVAETGTTIAPLDSTGVERLRLWTAAAPHAYGDLAAEPLLAPSVSREGFTPLVERGGVLLFNGRKRYELQIEQGRQYTPLAVMSDGSAVLARVGARAESSAWGSALVWLRRDRPPVLVEIARELSEPILRVTTSGWVSTASQICTGTLTRLDSCHHWDEIVDDLPQDSHLRVVDLNDDGTALGVLALNDQYTVVELRPSWLGPRPAPTLPRPSSTPVAPPPVYPS